MSKSNTFENDLLKAIFNGTPIAGLTANDAAGATLWVSLHVAGTNAEQGPGEDGTQATNEINYTGYARVGVKRDATGWVVVGSSVSPAANIDFPTGTGGAATATHFGIGTSETGPGKLLYSGTITPNIQCGNGVTPRLSTASTVTED